ncbi:hypothetical protein, partial [Nevskia soli]|uniref:hypothetical protein n=1 Tax=Nevskia soli TaxID=418856 RepID=UPI0015D8DAB3
MVVSRAVTIGFVVCAWFAGWNLSAAEQTQDPLLRILVSKGVITDAEAESLGNSANAPEQRPALIALLHKKGIISDAEYDALANSGAGSGSKDGATTLVASASPAIRQAAAQQKTPSEPTAAPDAPASDYIPAMAPIRPLTLEAPTLEGKIPSIKLGDLLFKPYGMLKSTSTSDSYSPRGDDFPVPGLMSDSGPDHSPEYHLKTRSSRVGFQVQGLDTSSDWLVTGRLEGDFEGNFSRVDNRNIATIRASSFSIRLGYFRLDHKLSDSTSAFVLLGQDWTPFGSSTLPNSVETTGLGVGFGTLYERLPQFRFGLSQKLGGSRNWKLGPEFAIMMPAFGNDPSVVDSQLGYGERQGADSARPELQSRVVLQWQLDKSPGVAPAELIVSGVDGERKATVLASAVPTAFKATFPTGADVTSGRYGYTGEAQLPTRFFTFLAKWYSGKDLRFYFAGQLGTEFNDTYGLTS